MARRDERRDDEDQFEQEGRNAPSLFLILLIVVAVISGAFVLQNRDSAQIQYLIFFESELKIWVAIAGAMLLGALLDRLVILWWRRSRKDRNHDD